MYALAFSLIGFFAVSQGREISDFEPHTKIVSGIDAYLGEFPFQVSIQKFGYHYCGGSILSPNYVITAGHCVYGETVKETFVYAGTVNKEVPYTSHRAVEFKLHENYESKTFANDIALIKVDPPFKFSNLVGQVLMPKPNEIILANTPVVVTGWGRLVSAVSDTPSILQKAQIYVVDQAYCRAKMLEVKQDVLDTNICAFDSNTRRGQCNGDSGGPLTIGRKLVGIVSYSYKDSDRLCASTVYPGVYTRVSEYIDWIITHATV